MAVGLLTPTAAQEAAGDIDHSGAIDIRDATLLLRQAIGL